MISPLNEPMNKHDIIGYKQAWCQGNITDHRPSSRLSYEELIELMKAHRFLWSRYKWRWMLTITFKRWVDRDIVDKGHKSLKPVPVKKSKSRKRRRASKADVERIIRLFNKFFFGRKHLKRSGCQLTMLVVWEGSIQDHPHIHILLEDHALLNRQSLADAMIHVSQLCESLQSLSEDDIDSLFAKLNQRDDTPPPRIKHTDTGRDRIIKNRIHMNIQEIRTSRDRRNVSRYVSKELGNRGFSNYDLMTSDDEDYYRSMTGDFGK